MLMKCKFPCSFAPKLWPIWKSCKTSAAAPSDLDHWVNCLFTDYIFLDSFRWNSDTFWDKVTENNTSCDLSAAGFLRVQDTLSMMHQYRLTLTACIKLRTNFQPRFLTVSFRIKTQRQFITRHLFILAFLTFRIFLFITSVKGLLERPKLLITKANCDQIWDPTQENKHFSVEYN